MDTAGVVRTLTPSDVDALIDALEARALARLKINIGNGVLALLGTWSIRMLVLGAAYSLGASGVFKHIFG
jgi:hypothetical protein